MKLKLSPIFQDFKKDVEKNFKEIQDKISGIKKIDDKTVKTWFDIEFNKKYDQLQKEIRSIVLPEMSPLQLTQDFINSTTDLKGIKHESLNERLKTDFKNNNSESKENNNLVVTKNGTVVFDYSKVSKTIKDVKRIYCVGDSVARGAHSAKGYAQFLQEKLNVSMTNLSVSGACFSIRSSNNVYNQVSNVRDADLVILQGTDDDWISNFQIGTDKTDIRTFYGSFYQMVKLLKINNKDVKIICMTATRQLPSRNKEIRRRDTDKNALGLTLEDYVNAQVIACTELDIPVFDAYHTDIMDPYNPGFRKKCMPDGLHPNELIHEVIMYKLLQNYYYFYG